MIVIMLTISPGDRRVRLTTSIRFSIGYLTFPLHVRTNRVLRSWVSCPLGRLPEEAAGSAASIDGVLHENTFPNLSSPCSFCRNWLIVSCPADKLGPTDCP